MNQANNEDAKKAIERLHNCKASIIENVAVVEKFGSDTVWKGIVHVFKIEGHAKTDKCYAWSSPIEGSTSTPEHRAEEVKKLHAEDYVKGPTPDYDGIPDKEWWEFGTYVKSYEIYIKISVYKNKGRCMSFHFPNYEITYPYKKRGECK